MRQYKNIYKGEEDEDDERNNFNIAFEPWNDTHFPLEVFEGKTSYQNMQWLPSNFSLRGSVSSPSSEQIKINIDYRPTGSCNISFQEFLDDLLDFRINFIVANEYFNPSGKRELIGTTLNDQLYKYISPRFHNYYDIFIEKNTYELDEGQLFSSKKEGNFYRIGKSNTHITERYTYTNNVTDIATIRFMLDSEVKHFEGRVYGIIDAIGTIGGVFETTFWFMMLTYGYIRKNVLLYYMVNSLNYTKSDNTDEIPKVTHQKKRNRVTPDKQNKELKDNSKKPNNLLKANYNMIPQKFKFLSEKKESEPDDNEKAETRKEEARHPISVLVKSCVPFSKYFCMTDNYEDYK